MEESSNTSLVTIVTPMYNSAGYISETIESVLQQTYQNWEMILVDDCSSDKSVEIVKRYMERDPRIHLIELKDNSGGAVARNAAINAAKGRYIAFLDSDDLWREDKLSEQVKFMSENDVKFSYSAYQVVNTQLKKIGEVGVPSRLSYKEMLKTNFMGCLTVIYDVAYFGKVEMPLIRRRQDYGLWLKLLKRVTYAYGVNQCYAKYRVHDGSLSSNKLTTSTFTWKILYEVESLGLFKSAYYFSHYAIRGLIRSKFPKLALALRLSYETND